MIAVSACLAGIACRYDGTAFVCPKLAAMMETGQAIAVCPEVLGGLTIPRPPAEIQTGRVVTIDGQDVTEAYRRGALAALAIVREHGCDLAVLKARSPSCGAGQIYDGGFAGRLVAGNGFFAELLRQAGIPAYTEQEFKLRSGELPGRGKASIRKK